MKGSRSHRLALSIVSVLVIMGGLFVSLAIYASKMIWPDPLTYQHEIASVDLSPDVLEAADQPNPASASKEKQPSSHLPNTIATLRKPNTPDTGGDTHLVISSLAANVSAHPPSALLDPHSFGTSLRSDNDISNLLPKRIAQVTSTEASDKNEGDAPVSVYSMGAPVTDTPPNPEIGEIAKPLAPMASQMIQAMEDVEYQMDMQIAALARPIDMPIVPAPPTEVFALANTTPQPLAETVFAMAELDIRPQRVDHVEVLAVSQSLSTPDLVVIPAPAPAAIVYSEPRHSKPLPIATPAILLAARSDDLNLSPPEASSRESYDDLVHHLAKVLAATPLPLPGAGIDVLQRSAPITSPRPQERLRPDPALPPAPERIAEPTQPSAEPTVAVVTPASAPAPTSIRSDDGRNRLSIIGIYTTDAAAWALLEMSDGRIIKATKGTRFDGLRVTRIGGDKIWIRDGGMEKGLTTGQVVVLE
ncbi:hypothetical protein [Aliiroseovarius sp. F47248L]|uniref:hypothetical protein n=1 Tax=Aliiroseovarius sp. F47248L TaxID=2926420 RepID=UPI001FF17E81|nr:hypothetical protein [Aliiroseovarius sp. F47248L]MCK0139713.1 hypothetical protein [Aliiroseovarius sp. F47248L]